MKILVIQQKMIGDVLTSTIVCEALKKEHPNAEVHYLINNNTLAVVEHHPFIDKIVLFKPSYKTDKTQFFKFLLAVRKENYTQVIDIYSKIGSSLITLFSGAKYKYGQDKWYTKPIYTTHINNSNTPITNAGLAIENRLRFVYPESAIATHIIAPKIFLTSQEKTQVAQEYLEPFHLEQNKNIVMVGVLGSEERKSLPLKTMAKLIDFIALKNNPILFNYAPDQKNDAKAIYELTQPKTKKLIYFDIFAKNLRDFLGILSHCNLLVGNEGGAINMAKALDKPTFSIFSPWILQNGWNLFEDGTKHKSIHLKQFKPELFQNKTTKQLKQNVVQLYNQFTADLIIPELGTYLKNY